MTGDELREKMIKGNVFVEFQGETYEVLQKFRHVAWIKKGTLKKSIPFRFFNYKGIVETEKTNWDKIRCKNRSDSELKELWKSL